MSPDLEIQQLQATYLKSVKDDQGESLTVQFVQAIHDQVVRIESGDRASRHLTGTRNFLAMAARSYGVQIYENGVPYCPSKLVWTRAQWQRERRRIA